MGCLFSAAAAAAAEIADEWFGVVEGGFGREFQTGDVKMQSPLSAEIQYRRGQM